MSIFFFFKQKTAYEMRISDWSSDVCSSDLGARLSRHARSSRRAHPRDPDRLAFRVDGGDGIGAVGRAAVRDARQRDRHGDADRLSAAGAGPYRSEEHTSELQSLMRISYAVFCLKKKKKTTKYIQHR